MDFDVLIFFDIETTSLNPETGKIIEIGAVKTKNLEIVDRFHTLVNPNQHISVNTTKITGIDDGKVKGAPQVEKVLPSFFDFIGDYPLVAHNIDFDTKFIEAASGKSIENILLDTMELACLVLPLEREHSQNSLMLKYCGTSEKHRATDDVESLLHIYKILVEKTSNLDILLRKEIKYLAQNIDWPWKHLFDAESLSQESPEVPLKSYPVRVVDGKEEGVGEEDDRKQLGAEEIRDFFEDGGRVNGIKENFERREQQIKMAEEIVKSLNKKKHLVIEAGTGVGKSLSYLIPTLLEAKINKNPVLISTYTKILQSQLEYDVPDLRKILNWDFKAQTVKGRKNYLCLFKWFRFYKTAREKGFPAQGKILSEEKGKEIEKYVKERLALIFLLNWLWHTETGNIRDEISYWLQKRLPLNDLFSETTSDSAHCLGRKCQFCKSHDEKGHNITNCFALMARNKAKDADLVIANHALLFENKIAGNDDLLPQTKQVIIDEAQHIEDAATDSLTKESSEKYVKEFLENIHHLGKKSPGFLDVISSRLRKLENSALGESLDIEIGGILEVVEQAAIFNNKFFSNLADFINKNIASSSENRYNYSKKLRLIDTVRLYDDWKKLILLEKDLRKSLKGIKKRLESFRSGFEKMETFNIKDFNFLLNGIEAAIKNFEECLNFHQEIIDKPRENYVYWLENYYLESENNREGKWFSQLKSAPINVGPMLKEGLYDQIESIIFTSATLSIDDSFKFINLRLGFNLLPRENIFYQSLSSPFDYSKQVLFVIISDLPGYNYDGDRGQSFFREVNKKIPEIIKRNDGGVLILCSSHQQVDILYEQTYDELELEGRQVLRQQKGISLRKTMEKFKDDANSVIFGTYSLWEGIDVPGDSLNCLIMIKLPFHSPKDPLIKAREEDIDNNGYDGKKDYYYPLAIMRLRQGFGRLIRSKTDKGIFIIFDKRLKTSQSYSEQFLNSFPSPLGKICKYLPFERCLEEIKKFNGYQQNKNQKIN